MERVLCDRGGFQVWDHDPDGYRHPLLRRAQVKESGEIACPSCRHAGLE